MKTSRPYLSDDGIRSLRALMDRDARLNLKEIQVQLLRVDGCTLERVAAYLGVDCDRVLAWRDRGVEKLTVCRTALYEVFARAAGEMLRCQRNTEACSQAEPLRDWRGNIVRVRSDQSLAALAERWLVWFLREGLEEEGEGA